MKKIAAITFHGAHNFGSNLQAYALQQFVSTLCTKYGHKYTYEILDLRTDKQKETYSIIKKNSSIKNIIKNILVLPYLKQLRSKHIKFENFIKNQINITSETYKNEEELKKANLQYHYYISGSDQLWNVRAYDFNWANYLSFVKEGKKISYAASFGPLNINWASYNKEKCSDLLNQYDYISVREQESYNNVKQIINKESSINVDPTMLLTKEEWLKLIGPQSNPNDKYILFYSLEPTPEILKLVNEISDKLKMPVVITKYNNKHDYFNKYIKKYDTGPIEFLKLINNAELIISSSFHGTVFSVLFNKPFFAIEGLKDNRISTLLKIMNLEERSISYSDVEEKCKNVFKVDFEEANKVIENERNKSTLYLKEALEIGG